MRQIFRSKFRVSQEFGVNAEYYKKFGLTAHEGIDLVPMGIVRDVLALADGVVVKDENNPMSGVYGNFVTLWHPSLNKATQYCHFKENYVENGQQVKLGDKLGLMGSSGNTSGAHLHLNLFETDSSGIRLNKNNGFLGGINPLSFINEDIQPSDTTAFNECKTQLADEIKKKNEMWNELQEVKTDLEAANSEIISHKNFQTQLAITLKTEDQPTAIMGQITKLLSEEDQLTKFQRDNADLKTQVQNITNMLDEKTGQWIDATKELTARENDVQSLTRTLEQTKSNLSTCQKNTKIKFTKLFLNLYIGSEVK